MARPVTLFTGQWADLSITDLVPTVKEMGYDGVELACWGDHFAVQKALNEDGYVDAIDLGFVLSSHESGHLEDVIDCST